MLASLPSVNKGVSTNWRQIASAWGGRRWDRITDITGEIIAPHRADKEEGDSLGSLSGAIYYIYSALHKYRRTESMSYCFTNHCHSQMRLKWAPNGRSELKDAVKGIATIAVMMWCFPSKKKESSTSGESVVATVAIAPSKAFVVCCCRLWQLRRKAMLRLERTGSKQVWPASEVWWTGSRGTGRRHLHIDRPTIVLSTLHLVHFCPVLVVVVGEGSKAWGARVNDSSQFSHPLSLLLHCGFHYCCLQEVGFMFCKHRPSV